MTKNEAFNIWKSQVEAYLEQMVKENSGDLRLFDLLQNFKKGVSPKTMATRIISSKYRVGNPNEEHI